MSAHACAQLSFCIKMQSNKINNMKKISAVHVSVLTMLYIFFFKKSCSFVFFCNFSSYLNIKMHISPLIDKLNIFCGYLFS